MFPRPFPTQTNNMILLKFHNVDYREQMIRPKSKFRFLDAPASFTIWMIIIRERYNKNSHYHQIDDSNF